MKFVLLSIFSVVKEEIIDDDAHLPCFNGRVVSWVSTTEIPANFISWVWHCVGLSIVLILKFEIKKYINISFFFFFFAAGFCWRQQCFRWNIPVYWQCCTFWHEGSYRQTWRSSVSYRESVNTNFGFYEIEFVFSVTKIGHFSWHLCVTNCSIISIMPSVDVCRY